MDPLDDALMAKHGQGSFLQGLQRGAIGASGALGGAAAVAAVVHGARKLVDAATKRQDFNAMMDNNPDLEEAQSGNPKFFNASYNSIRSLSPVYGKDPIVAGSLLRRMMQNPESAGTILLSTTRAPVVGPEPVGFTLETGGGKAPRYRQEF